MNEAFAKISQETVDQNSKSFLQLAETKFAPFKELLSKTQQSVQDLETKRVKAYTELESATKQIIEETTKLETALRRPDHRGRWGEVGLRNVVEFAGMAEHCDFEEQVVTGTDQSLRPDMVINMPGGGQLVVDSKLPLEHYLNAIEDPKHAAEHLDKHAKALEVHVNALAKKVLLTSPATLVALLQAAAFGWRQDSMAKNAEEIAKAGQELYDRLAKFQSHLARVGNRLHQATESYNNAVGSFTTRLEPGAKRLSELHSTGGKELPVTEPVDIEPRVLE
jgi:DNA recombination protein RmuC